MKGDAAEQYRRRIAEIERELLQYSRLVAERDGLLRLIEIVEGTGAELAFAGNGSEAARVPITPAIFDFVRAHPGITGPELADRLRDRVITQRPDRRHALIARTHELVKEGRLTRDSAGRLSISTSNGVIRKRKR
jgi:hypothetical protein